MSVSCGFYNSVSGDRKYNAEEMSRIFDGLIRDGIYESIGTAMIVKEGDGMTVNVGIGRAWFNHTWTYNDSILPITLDVAEAALMRIDAVVLEVNSSEEVRNNSIKIVKGIPSSVPVKPDMINNAYVHQYPLAYITVASGVTKINQADIENMVGTSTTPFVVSIIENVMSVDELISQWRNEYKLLIDRDSAHFNSWISAKHEEINEWFAIRQSEYTSWYANSQQTFDEWFAIRQSEYTSWYTNSQQTFDDWFASLEDTLSGDVAANLAMEISKRNTKTYRFSNLTLSRSGWISGDSTISKYPYKYELTLDGMMDSWECKTFVLDHTLEEVPSFLYPFVYSDTDKLTLWSAELPDSDILIENMTFEEVLT